MGARSRRNIPLDSFRMFRLFATPEAAPNELPKGKPDVISGLEILDGLDFPGLPVEKNYLDEVVDGHCRLLPSRDLPQRATVW